MAMDMFLKIPGIDGESGDKKHGKEIDVLSWSWGMSQSGSFHAGGGGGAGKVSVQDLSVTKWVDLATPILMLYTSNGDQFPKATLTVRKAGKQPLEYIIINMEKVMVTSVSTGGSGGEDKLTENVTFNFAKCDVKYTEQKGDGSAGTAKTYTWDIVGNDGDAS